MPTRSRSRLTSAQKQPCAFRYSGQMPGCSAKAPTRASEKISGFRMNLQRAMTMSGLTLFRNAREASLFGFATTTRGTASRSRWILRFEVLRSAATSTSLRQPAGAGAQTPDRRRRRGSRAIRSLRSSRRAAVQRRRPLSEMTMRPARFIVPASHDARPSVSRRSPSWHISTTVGRFVFISCSGATPSQSASNSRATCSHE